MLESTLEWMLVGIGFTGALTLVFVVRAIHWYLGWVPSTSFYFSPKGGCMVAIVAELKRARREILVQAYSFTCQDIAKALIEAKERGVRVTILLDRTNEKETYSELKLLEQNGLMPHIDAHHAIAHNKIIIIDKRTLITGSFNFTSQAEHENAENLLILRHHAELIEAYRKNFEMHQAHCQAPGAAKPVTPVHEHFRRAA